MPETKEGAKERAKELGFSQEQVVKASTGEYFIAPHGITTLAGKKAYAECRAKGGEKGTCAAVAHEVDYRHKRK